MLTQTIEVMLVAVINNLFGWLPTSTPWSFPDPAALGQYLGAAQTVIPVTDVVFFLAVWVPVMGVFIVYRAFSWVWNHIPTIAGFGVNAS